MSVTQDDAQHSKHVQTDPAEANDKNPAALWTGILSESDLERLLDKYADFVVCPGYTGRFGNMTDRWGRLLIPGCKTSWSEANKRLSGWQEKSKCDPRYNWWIQHIKDQGIKPITGGDVIQGLSANQWRPYQVAY
ncbi:unnamed protein product [Sympodiomycopsis kandeliae]